MLRIEPLPNGRVKLVKDYKDPLTGGRKRLSKTVDKATRQVQKQVELLLDQRFEREVELSTLNNPHKTLGELIDEWLVIRKERLKPSTYRSQITAVRQVRSGIGNNALLIQLNRQFLVRYLDDQLYKHSQLNSNVKKQFMVLNLMLKYAVQVGYLNDNPAPDYDSISWKKEHKTERQTYPKFLDSDELDRLLTYLRSKDPFIADFCELLYLTGMRFGEAASLQPKNFYTVGNYTYAKIIGTLDYSRINRQKATKSDTPKTEASFRSIRLSSRAIEICNKYRVDKRNTEYLFLRHGYPLSATLVDYHLSKAEKELKIKKRVSTHTFRHTHISKLAELGVPLYVIQDRVGHADEKITKEIYLHVTNKSREQAEDKIELL